MFIKEIFPIQILNKYANVMIFTKEYSIYPSDSEKQGLINYASVKVEIEFYDENKKPIHKCEFVIDELPINNNIRLISDSDFTTPDAKIMFNIQHQKIFDEIKEKYRLIYYDDTYKIDKKMVFSYIKLDDYYHYY
jgi:hypothetical protein